MAGLSDFTMGLDCDKVHVTTGTPVSVLSLRFAMQAKVLVIEDDTPTSEMVVCGLKDLGLEASAIADGARGLEEARAGDYNLIILDVLLPGKNGLDICRILRQEKPSLPILMLTSRSEEIDKVLGLELGATDYLVKPFSIRELCARVRSILSLLSAVGQSQSGGFPSQDVIVRDSFQLDPEKRRVSVGGKPIELTATEFDILHILVSSPGRPFSRDELSASVTGDETGVYEATITNHINRIRGKIEADPSKPRYVLTVRGIGYAFADE